MKIGDLFLALGFDVDDKKLDGFNEKVKAGKKELFKMSAMAAGAVFAVNSFVSGSVKSATALRNFNTQTGESIEGLQKWQSVARQTNSAINAEQVTSSFLAISDAMAQVAEGKGGGAFALLDIDTKGKSVLDILESVRVNYDKLLSDVGGSQQRLTARLQAIGIDPNLLGVLKLSNREFEKLAKGKFLSGEQNAKLVSLGDTISKLKLDIELLMGRVSAANVDNIIQSIDLAINKFIEFKDNITVVFDVLKSMGEALPPESIAAFKVAIGLLMVAFAPFSAAVIATLVALNDIGKFVSGKDSFIGRVKGGIEEVGHAAGRGVLDVMDLMSGTPFQSKQNSLNRSTVIHNTYNIQSTADAFEFSNQLAQQQKRMLSHADESNLGSAFK